MAPKGRTFFLIFFVACAALAVEHDRTQGKKQDFKYMTKTLMKKCQDKGYPRPQMGLLKTVFARSDVPGKDEDKDEDKDQPDTPLTSFMNILDSVVPGGGSLSRAHPGDVDKMKEEMMNFSNLPSMIKKMRNSSEASACYMKAFVASLCWKALTKKGSNNTDSDDYDTLLSGTKPVVLDMPSTGVNFPEKLAKKDVKKWAKMLREMYVDMREEKRAKVLGWEKEQITQNYFGCTTMPKSDSKSGEMQRCKSSVKWLNSDALMTLGPFLSYLKAADLDSSPKEVLQEFFKSGKLKEALGPVRRMVPRFAKRLLQRLQECCRKEEFAPHMEKLGMLVCYYNPPQNLTRNLSKKLLSLLERCDDDSYPRIKKLKKYLANSMISNVNISQELQELGKSITSLPATTLSKIPSADLLKAIRKYRPDYKWTRGQKRALLRKIVGSKKCKDISREELVGLGSVASCLPNCILKHVRASELLNDIEGLRNISKRMNKGRMKALLQGLYKNTGPSELVKKLPENLLRCMSLKSLQEANITSWDQVGGKNWTREQATLLMQKISKTIKFKFSNRMRKISTVLQGVTCKMIEKTSDNDVPDMVRSITSASRLLSKMQVRCAARRLFARRLKGRPDFFQTITEEEMRDIPMNFLPYMQPEEVMKLPDSVCSVLLDKMEEADPSSSSAGLPSRLALTQRALRFLTKGSSTSSLAIEDVERLGPFLCYLPPPQLQLMDSGVRNYSLETMASCKHIPEKHKADLIQLIKKNYGPGSTWSAETTEALFPLLASYDDCPVDLPFDKPWMKDLLYYLNECQSCKSKTLRKKLFDTIVDNKLDAARRKRTVSGRNDGSTTGVKVPTTELIEELKSNNVFWEAAQLKLMSRETFTETVDTLGDVPDFRADQLSVLSQKAIEAFGPLSQMTEDEVVQLGCITRGFSNKDLQALPFSLDTLEDIADCDWDDIQGGCRLYQRYSVLLHWLSKA
ncbi:otoancorin [Xyrichtys novacula]|uniref:Otoancorin n=1 Tax=Xyrichtys novacula TaxID=13765 RepID=A0AAV1FLC6_XYRNO|nr:otoancorin [Xyrichtys novacula]